MMISAKIERFIAKETSHPTRQVFVDIFLITSKNRKISISRNGKKSCLKIPGSAL